MNIKNKLISILGEENVFENEPMKNHTTFKTGGAAQFLVTPKCGEEIFSLITLLKNENIPYYIIGNGSNILVSDRGLFGVVILISQRMGDITVSGNEIMAGAGALLSRIAAKAYASSLSGFEFASGIPGSLGGAAAMNAGAYGEEMSGVIKSITYIDPACGIKTIKNSDCGFSYRHTFFTDTDFVIVSAVISLNHGDKAEIKAKTDDLRQRRTSKQPLSYPSAGSTFKRPEGHFAGALIENANLKGFKIGGAEVSEKHAGFIINKNNATSTDIINLIKKVRETVHEKSGVWLSPEVKLLGFDGESEIEK